MKKYITLFCLALVSLLICSCCSRDANKQRECVNREFVVCQFNMRFGLENDGLVLERKKLPNGKIKVVYDGSHIWEKRFPKIKAFLEYNEVDICGTQELSWFQVECFDVMKEFAYIGTPTFPENYAKKIVGANNIILYRKDRFQLLQKGDFWLSETPEKVSNGFGANKPRNCNWGKFKDKRTGKVFYFFNTHFHHIGDKTKIESAKLFVKKVREISNGQAFITTGDLNINEDSEGIKIIKESGFMIDARQICKTPLYGAWWTNNFGYTGRQMLTYPTIPSKTPKQQKWIDWVFVSSNVEVFKYAVLAECYDGMWLSDHYPLLLKVAVK